MAGSAAAPPALPELTLFTLNLTGKVSVVSVKKGRVVTPRPVSVQDLGRFCGLTFRFLTSVHKMGPFHGLNPLRDVKKAGSGMQGKPAPPPLNGQSGGYGSAGEKIDL